MNSFRKQHLAALAAAIAVAGAGMGIFWDKGPQAHAAAAAVLPQVKYKTALQSQVFDAQDYTGRLEAVDLVDVRPKVPGTLLKVHFKDGQRVQQNDLLFSIDTAPFTARLQQVQAGLVGAQARLRHADMEQQRARRLVESQSISQREFEALDNAASEALAALKGAQAAVAQAQLDLSYTQVRAPIAGRISRAEITAGNVVGSGGDSAPLTRIVSENKLYASFNVDEQSYLRLIAPSLRSGAQPAVKVGLAVDADFPHAASLEALDNRMDTRSGTVRVRARVDRVSPEMLPGLQARVRLQGAVPYQAVVVDDAVVGTDQDRKYVLVVNAQNKVERRFVELGVLQGSQRVLRSGIEPGARVIVDGAYRAAPGAAVSAVEAGAPAASAPMTSGARS
ncbi:MULTISPECIES: efflux RND transporter periplasmic adaptor subunit [unclassified Variovorax]|uniref:efflux RND transporter periplasmic adaptor subunit n=1 Tax=unclassified Variovorax TaxID=663243 RepID=UPI0008B9F150|nr:MULTISPECIES: efflux RND transporter periplasmic adaptor subunit [unclassified Variovorax]SEK10547.1 membrane fusion protein, multidrug efflux system [Variovorax sp. OK202]SFD68759.1 membrane fusion protein, multidrug efflux system [Variovorax sp. OK212]